VAKAAKAMKQQQKEQAQQRHEQKKEHCWAPGEEARGGDKLERRNGRETKKRSKTMQREGLARR
jgi:hypothetical protein